VAVLLRQVRLCNDDVGEGVHEMLKLLQVLVCSFHLLVMVVCSARIS
jgi:hypothetical protein